MADKVTLIDTVKAPFREEMLARIADVIDRDGSTTSSPTIGDGPLGMLPEVIAAVKLKRSLPPRPGPRRSGRSFPRSPWRSRPSGTGRP
jgi:hypothetical protein